MDTCYLLQWCLTVKIVELRREYSSILHRYFLKIVDDLFVPFAPDFPANGGAGCRWWCPQPIHGRGRGNLDYLDSFDIVFSCWYLCLVFVPWNSSFDLNLCGSFCSCECRQTNAGPGYLNCSPNSWPLGFLHVSASLSLSCTGKAEALIFMYDFFNPLGSKGGVILKILKNL